MRRLALPGLVCACAVAGAVLVALPWVDRPQPRSLPPQWGKDSRTHALVRAAAAAADAACRAGDVPALRDRITTRYFEVLQGLLWRDGRRLDADSLRQQRLLVGDLTRLPLLVGVAAPAAAVAVYARERAGVEHEVEGQGILALRFTWDGFDLRLDDKVGRAVAAGESIRAAAHVLAQELLPPSINPR